MKILGINFGRRKLSPRNTIIDPETYVSGFLDGLNDGKDRSMKIATVFRCIDLLSDYLSMLPFFVTDARTRAKLDDNTIRQILYLLNSRPNQCMTPRDFLKCLEKDRLQEGNGYAEIVTAGNGTITSLEYIPAHKVTMRKTELFNGEYVYDISDDYGIRTLLSGEILHFKGISDDGIKGKSVLTYARETIDAMTYQEKFSKTFYESGGRPSGILSYETDLATVAIKRNPEDKHGTELRDVLRNAFQKQVGGAGNAGKVAITDMGSKYTPIQPMSQRDMAFVESKEISIADIARFFGVPLYLLFTGKESYQSNEQNKIAFVTDKITPIITGYEQELSFKLFAPGRLRGGISVKGNLNVLLRGDYNTRTNGYQRMRNIGAMSVNEIRRLEDMEDVPGGDERLASLNFVPLSDFKELSRKRNGLKREPQGED